jgi:hypothetical protein
MYLLSNKSYLIARDLYFINLIAPLTTYKPTL